MAYLKYVERHKQPANVDTKASDRGTAIHAAVESYLKGEAQQLDPLLAKVAEFVEHCKAANDKGLAEIEQEWAFDRDWQITGYFDENCWVRLKLDVFIRWDETLGEVIDWKSGKSYGNEVKHAQQGMLYAIAAFMRYPDMQRVRIRFVYTDEGKWEKAKEYDRGVVMRLLPGWDERARAFTDAQTWPVKPNVINCKFCWFGPNNGGNGLCPAGVEAPPAKHSSMPKSQSGSMQPMTSNTKSRTKSNRMRVRRLST
jgi:hypothetical protein